MVNDLKATVAARLKRLIGGRPVIDLGSQGGPSRSYIYRMMKAGTNPSIEELDAVLRAYGSNLGEFFSPMREDARMERQQFSAEARVRMERILASDVDINGLVDFLRVLDPGEKRTSNKGR
jgi:hypothetical protein